MVMHCTPHFRAFWAFYHQELLEAKGKVCKVGRMSNVWYVIHG